MIIAVEKRIIGRLFELEKKSGSLFLPCPKNYKTIQVIAMGKDVDHGIDRGDILIVPSNCGTEIEIHGDKYISVLENDVLAVWRDE